MACKSDFNRHFSECFYWLNSAGNPTGESQSYSFFVNLQKFFPFFHPIHRLVKLIDLLLLQANLLIEQMKFLFK